jgi:hypothetical protein
MHKHASATSKPDGYVLVTVGRAAHEVLFSRAEALALVGELLAALGLSPWIQGEVMAALED